MTETDILKCHCVFRFDSSVAPLIFQDQFIKISTALTSSLLYGLGEHRQPLVINITENWERLTFYAHDFPPVQNVNLYGKYFYCLTFDFSRKKEIEISLSRCSSISY